MIEGAHIGESKSYAETLVEEEGLTYVNGYDDPSIVAGAGTIGVEVGSQLVAYLFVVRGYDSC